MLKKTIFIVLACFFCLQNSAQEIQIDGRLQPHLTEFFKLCDRYNIPYRDKFSLLETIDVVSNLPISEEGMILGRLRRDTLGNPIAIDISWIAQLDKQILKVVAYHEFAHYFLEYSTHVCQDCGKIMSVVNSSYFEVINDWEHQIQLLFTESPAYRKRFETSVSSVYKNLD